MPSLTLEQTAEELCSSIEHVRRLIDDHELVAFNVARGDRRKLVVDQQSLEAFKLRRQVEGKNHPRTPLPRSRSWEHIG